MCWLHTASENQFAAVDRIPQGNETLHKTLPLLLDAATGYRCYKEREVASLGIASPLASKRCPITGIGTIIHNIVGNVV